MGNSACFCYSSSIKMSLAKTKLTKEKEHNCPSVLNPVLLSYLRVYLTEADINLKAPQAEGLVTMSPSLVLGLFLQLFIQYFAKINKDDLKPLLH